MGCKEIVVADYSLDILVVQQMDLEDCIVENKVEVDIVQEDIAEVDTAVLDKVEEDIAVDIVVEHSNWVLVSEHFELLDYYFEFFSSFYLNLMKMIFRS